MNDIDRKQLPPGESHGTPASEAALARAYEGALAYLRTTRDQSTYVPVTQSEIRKRLGTKLPDKGEPSEKIMESLIEARKDATAPTMGGRFFAYVIGGTHPAGVASEILNAAWDDKPGTPLVSPFGCAIDGLVGEWVLELLDLPRESSVGIVTGASLGNFLCIAAARHALLKREGWDVEAQGLYGAPVIHVLISDEAHPTVHKSLRLAGLGAKRIIPIETDAQGAMRPDRLAAALKSVKGPVLVSSQAGNINTGAMDPYAEIGPMCRERGAWLHVDGAFGLWARVSPQLAGSIRGVELADSWATDAHKMLNTPYDAGFGIVRDAAAHTGAMDISATYLVQAEGARDPSRFVPELSRRARGTPIYATIRALGREGVREMIENCCANARRMRDLITKRAGVTCLNEVVFNQAIFRFAAPGTPGDDAAGDATTTRVATRVRESGECWVQSSQWRGRTVMRFSVSDRATTPADIERAAAAVLKAYDEETRA